MPDVEQICHDALMAGGLNPLTLRFRIVEYRKSSGELIGVPKEDLAFSDAVAKTMALIARRADSHFCLEPVGFVQ